MDRCQKSYMPNPSAFALGLMGVTCFSLTLPMTRYAVPMLGPELVGPGRSLLAAAAATILLAVLRRPLLPPRHLLSSVIITAAGSVVGFPLLLAQALTAVSASHAAVTLAFLPAVTAIMAVARAGERLALNFWLWCACGTALTAGYLGLSAHGSTDVGDLELIGAVLLCAAGYCAGGTASRQASGWLLTCWSVIVASPAVLLLVLITGLPGQMHVTLAGLLALAYLGLGSSLIAFFCWYQALAIGGIAKIGQITLLQPILTMLFAALLLGERLSPGAMLIGLAIAATVLMAQRAQANSHAQAALPSWPRSQYRWRSKAAPPRRGDR